MDHQIPEGMSVEEHVRMVVEKARLKNLDFQTRRLLETRLKAEEAKAAAELAEAEARKEKALSPGTDKGLRVAEDGERVATVLEAWPGAPVADDCVMPWPYAASGAAVVSVGSEEEGAKDGDPKIKIVSPCPIVVAAAEEDVGTGTVEIEIAYQIRGNWYRWAAAREKMLDSGQITRELGQSRFPIGPHVKTRLANYLGSYELHNFASIPRRRVTRQMGWQTQAGIEKEHLGFVLGNESIVSDIAYRAQSDGEQQFADAVGQRGDLGEWQRGIGLLAKYPRARVAVLGSFAAPLLELVDVPNFCIDLSYRTSSGKTTALRAAASVWGCPDERASRSYIVSWDATPVFLEKLFSARNHLPCLVDDTKRARRSKHGSIVPQIVYTVGNGQGRGRGSLTGTRLSGYFRTILITTSEGRVVDESKDGGLATRVLSLWGPPFGATDGSASKDISDMNACLLLNYGVAGRKWVSWLLDHHGERGAWRKRVEDLAKSYVRDAPEGADGAIVGRVADYLAVIHLAGELVHRAGIVPWAGEPFDGLLGGMFGSAVEGDRTRGALESIWDWTISNRAFFEGWSGSVDKVPSGGWLGTWDRTPDSKGGPKWYGYNREKLVETLRRNGYDAEAVIRDMQSRGMLETTEDGRQTMVVKRDGKTQRVVAIKKGCIEPAACEDRGE